MKKCSILHCYRGIIIQMEREKSFFSNVSVLYGSLQISLQFCFLLFFTSARHNSTIKTFFLKKNK